MSLFEAFLFSEKRFCHFRGMASEGVGTEGMSQNRGFLFSENHFCRFRGMASEGCKMGRFMSQKRGFLFSEKRFCRKRDIKQPILLKNCKNGLKYVPKSGFLISRKKVLPKKGHAKKKQVFNNFQMHENCHTIHAHKNEAFFGLPNLAKSYHFVIILLSSSNA